MSFLTRMLRPIRGWFRAGVPESRTIVSGSPDIFEASRSEKLRRIEELGLDAEAIADDLETQRYSDRVRVDLLGGMRSAVNGTPTFFVNGLRHDGGYGLADLLAAVDSAAG